MRIYKYSMRFRVPALDQSDCSICYNYDLNKNKNDVQRIEPTEVPGLQSLIRLDVLLASMPSPSHRE